MIKLILEFKTAKKFSIGSGGLPIKTIADVTFPRLLDRPFIPATTIKGVLRTSMIRVAPLLGFEVSSSVHPTKIKDDRVTQLMGKPNKNGKIRVYSAILDVDTFTLTHATINDKSRVAKEHALFTIEYIPKDIKFDIVIEANDLTLDEARLLFAGIAEMRYERIGKNGLMNIKISNNSTIPDDLRGDKVISNILEVLMR
ncbi:MAG: hypothetical protein KatS3mg003_2040 [Candidatus Nitrosocaldaceae archaeon]|nr:MAG: hypothetical protein KatS3mg003_2040 [Candidatus Nitrosocaldaceae archaeon]